MKRLFAFIMAMLTLCAVSVPALAASTETIKAGGLLLGDVTEDGVVNTGDATLILKVCSGMYTFTESQLKVADANNDGDFNTADATYVLKVAAGMVEPIYVEPIDEPDTYNITYASGLPEGTEAKIPEATVAVEDSEFTITRIAVSEGLTFIGWQTDFDGKIYAAGDKFIMPSQDIILTARWNDVDPVYPTTAPTTDPTTDPTTQPTSNPTGAPTTQPTVQPTVVPTVAPTVAPTIDPSQSATIVFLPGDNAENGGGVVEDSMPSTKYATVGSNFTLPKDKIPHSVTLAEGEENAYAFICWKDENGAQYRAGDTMLINDKKTYTLTAVWESGYRVLTSPADIETYVFDDLDNNVILGSDITLYYYNTEYFFPIGFDSDSPYDQILYKGPFTGKFDGAGYTIYNLTCEYASSDICSAFFYINEGIISNFTFKLNQLYASSTLMAGIACTNKGTISNVDVTWWRRTGYHYATDVNADITSFDVTRGARVGGIAAINEGTISGCNVDGLTLKVCHGLSGGLVAYNDDSGVITNCNSNGVKITFVYDHENYNYSGYEVNSLVAIDLGSTIGCTASGFAVVTSDTFWENSIENPVVLPKKRDCICSNEEV